MATDCAAQLLGAVCDTQFDPAQLIGTQIPFIDPFAFDENAFRTSGFARCRSAPAASHPTLQSSLGRAAATSASSQEDQHAPATFIQLLQCMPLHRTLSFPPTGPVMYTTWEPGPIPYTTSEPGPVVCTASKPGPVVYPASEPGAEAVPDRAFDRARLTPDQAIDIFKMKRTKTARTASLLATKYGVTPKAIRDIWRRKSWSQETRPHWNK